MNAHLYPPGSMNRPSSQIVSVRSSADTVQDITNTYVDFNGTGLIRALWCCKGVHCAVITHSGRPRTDPTIGYILDRTVLFRAHAKHCNVPVYIPLSWKSMSIIWLATVCVYWLIFIRLQNKCKTNVKCWLARWEYGFSLANRIHSVDYTM